MRHIYHPKPTYTLTQCMTIQLQIRKIVENPILMRTPLIIEMVLKHLEGLADSNHISKKKIFSSFYDLDNHTTFEGVWDDLMEVRLKTIKDLINKGSFQVYQESDTRILVQLMLDFLESLKEPAISRTTVSHLSKQVNSGLSSHDILSDQLAGGYLVPRDPTTVDLSY